MKTIFPALLASLLCSLFVPTPTARAQATISWTPGPPCFVLQETLSLAPSKWVNSTSGAANPVTVPATLSTIFYRLRKP